MHAALILDLANNKKDAAKRYERAYKADAVAVRNVEAYGRFLSRNGNKDEALKIYSEFEKTVPNHPLIVGRGKASRGRREAAAARRTRRRPAPPRRCTVSVPRSAGAAAKISR